MKVNIFEGNVYNKKESKNNLKILYVKSYLMSGKAANPKKIFLSPYANG